MFKRIVAIGIWVNRFQFTEYFESGELKTFASYQRAAQFIIENGLPVGASPIEIYVPV